MEPSNSTITQGGEGVKYLNFRATPDLHTRLKIAAAQAGRPAGDLVCEALELYLAVCKPGKTPETHA